VKQHIGSIPDCIGEISSLTILDLTSVTSDNRSPGIQSISGTLPTSLCDLKLLTYLFLQSTQGISGSIPVCLGWGDQQQILAIAMHMNKLTGSLPESLCNIGSSFQDLLIYENRLTGSIPACIGNLKQTLWFETHHNSMSGVIPNTMCDMDHLQIMQLDANRSVDLNIQCVGFFVLSQSFSF
jgi:hypothetical protein